MKFSERVNFPNFAMLKKNPEIKVTRTTITCREHNMTTRNLSDSNYVSNQEGTSLLPLKRLNKGSRGCSS